jgi:transcription-repair coupling factor (superfamily II helicase)
MDAAFHQLLEKHSRTSAAASIVTRAGSGTKASLASGLLGRGRSVAILARNTAEIAEMRALLSLLAPNLSGPACNPVAGKPEILPAWEGGPAVFSQYPQNQKSRSFFAERVASLYSLRQNNVSCILFSPDALFLRTPPADFFDHRVLPLTKGMDMPQDLILEQLTEWGYTRVQMVGEHGEFSVRGDILDIFCPGYPRPVRLEFFGDNLEDLRLFDPSTQRSQGNIAELALLPATLILPEAALMENALERWKDLASQGRLGENDLYGLRKELESGGRNILPGMYYARAAGLMDWFPENTVLLLPGNTDFSSLLEETEVHLHNSFAGREREELYQPHALTCASASEVGAWAARQSRVYFEDLKVGIEAQGLDLPERDIRSFQDLFPLPEDQERPWQRLVAAMQLWSRNHTGSRTSRDDSNPEHKPVVILSFSSERSRAKFMALAGQDDVIPKVKFEPERPGLYALVSPFRRGLNLVWRNTLILGEDVLQPHAERVHRPGTEVFKGLDRYDGLEEGSLLVHRDYGICAFGGLQHLQLAGVSNDFLLLRYANEDKLYLPVDRLGLIQVFKSPEGYVPALDKLGGSQWATGKEKARKAIEKIAEDLVEMYAYRKVAKGFGYGPVNEMYREFEATFGFEETPDQARAIEEVMADMEKPEPMDRLVCGDVGFGKTEVALRASFRAALEGRQVALLCPTTVLAEQHYQTFRARLSEFPLNVGLLSRFVSKAGQKEVLDGLQRGQVDIVIGTHRLLSKDVAIPRLGLIVLDEEQRFGVRHKEILKQMRKNVDVLTLTATPIPRTLQLSLSGVRELSVIETPPPERKPVATALINRDEAALRSVIERELGRQGQVFWVYNRVQGLERVTEYVGKLAPQARIGMAHGQMNEKALEETMRKFWHGDLDILVCTSIVESGLDFPRANTLVVDQAQLFGLGQLYQLRGRVGRSERQAFALFICPDVENLPETTRKRMQIILDLDYLGAGFQIAMEDLRLRGAGNILGESQSGHMQRLGLDLFLEMLEEAVAKMRGAPLREEVQTELSLSVEAHIPEKYIEDGKERLRCYKALSSAPDEAGQREIEFELRDRFGPIPPELANFLAVLNFKRHLGHWGVSRADILPDRLKMHFNEKQTKLDPSTLVAWVAGSRGKARIHPPATLELMLAGDSVSDKLRNAYTELSHLL